MKESISPPIPEKVRPLACGREDDQKEDNEEEPLFS
jgi:hypothetical protein